MLVSRPDAAEGDLYVWKWSPMGRALDVRFVQNSDTGSAEYAQRACLQVSETDVARALQGLAGRH